MVDVYTHNLAVAYAEAKLKEYEIAKREAPMDGNTNFSEDEIRYFQSAYDFAVKHLSE